MRRLRCHCMDRTPSSRVGNHGALVDRGANGGICGCDARLISKSPWVVTVRGLNQQEILNVPLVTAGGVITTSSGDAVRHDSSAPLQGSEAWLRRIRAISSQSHVHDMHPMVHGKWGG